MSDFFTVDLGKEPTEQQARDATSATWSKWMRNSPNTFREEGRAEFVESEWKNYIPCLRALVGSPLETVEYPEDLSDFGDLMTVEEFRSSVQCGGFIDYDGYGCPVKDGKQAKCSIYPSYQHLIPLDATHIIWFNR